SQARDPDPDVMTRSARAAIQGPAAPAGVAIRTRKSGLAQGAGMFAIVPAKAASPCSSRGTGVVSRTFWVWVSGLHTKVPVTALTGPGVPVKAVPLITSPSTLNEVAPLERFTLAWPCRTDQAKVPL